MDKKEIQKSDQIKEESAAYQVYGEKQQGEYTLEDYYAIPDERRVELIDGVIYDMAAPSWMHQTIALEIGVKLRAFVNENNGRCMVGISPIDVQLDKDDRTMLQPDVMIVCDKDKIENRCLYGEPDLAIEIISPSSKQMDMMLKLNKYRNAGVKEYWIVDPEEKRVIVYEFEKGTGPAIYGFDAEVPVGIWNGTCKVDFRRIYEEIEFLYDR